MKPMIDSSATISLREVTKENLWPVMKLRVSPAQERFVAANSESIAEAYFSRQSAWFRAIYADETPIGFLMIDDHADDNEYFLWRLMIAADYQRMGFGYQAMQLLIEQVKGRPGAVELKTSYVPGEGSPGPFYKRLGFEETGEMLGDERVMALQLI